MGFGSKSKFSQSSGKESGGYFSPSKIATGESARFHVLDEQPFEFWELWCESADGERRTIRFSEDPAPADIEEELQANDLVRGNNKFDGKPETVKEVTSFRMWNYETESVQIASFTQKSIRNKLMAIGTTEDYQPFEEWDVQLSKKKNNDRIEYDLAAVPRKKGFDRDAAVAEAKSIKLDALLTNENPFA